MRIWVCMSILMSLALLGLKQAHATGESTWPVSSHDAQSTNFNPGELTLSTSTVGLLRPAWTYLGVRIAVVSGSRVYAYAANGFQNQRVVILDAGSGKVLRS